MSIGSTYESFTPSAKTPLVRDTSTALAGDIFQFLQTALPRSRLHPVLSSRDFSNWSVLFIHLRLQRIQQHLACSQQTIKQRLQQRHIEMRHEVLAAVNDGKNAVYSEEFLRDLKQDSA